MDNKKIDNPIDIVTKASVYLNKAFKVLNYPHARFREEVKKYEQFKKSTLKPLERELSSWKDIQGNLESIMTTDNASAKYSALDLIQDSAKETNDKYRKKLLKKMDEFGDSGIKDDQIKMLSSDITEIITHYSGEVNRMNREKAPSKVKRYGWGAATVATYGTILYGVLRYKFRK